MQKQSKNWPGVQYPLNDNSFKFKGYASLTYQNCCMQFQKFTELAII